MNNTQIKFFQRDSIELNREHLQREKQHTSLNFLIRPKIRNYQLKNKL
jgi:hypothetical protein